MTAGEDWIVRNASFADAAAIARVHMASWRTTYPGIVPQAYLDSLEEGEFAARWKGRLQNAGAGIAIFVVERAGQVIGFAAGGPLREPVLSYDGELHAIYLLAEAQRSGMGRALVREVARALASRGFRSIIAWVLAANPARGFYEHLGAIEVAQKTASIGGLELLERGYGWPSLEALTTP